MLDVARRIAGTGSLGVQRYVILIEGKGSIGGHYLLDLKQSLGSCVAPHFKYLQPLWRVQAHRIGALQRPMQTMLQPVQFEGSAYVLCELQSTKDRVSLDRAQQNSKDLEMTIFEINGYQEVAALLSPNFQVHISALRPDKWLKAAALAFDLVVLIFAASWSSMRGRALVHGDRQMANKELTVLGVCNMVSSPFARRACRCGFFSPLGQCCCWRAKPLGKVCKTPVVAW